MSLRTVMKPHMKNNAVTMVSARVFVDGSAVTTGVSDSEAIPFSLRTGMPFRASQALKPELIQSNHFPGIQFLQDTSLANDGFSFRFLAGQGLPVHGRTSIA